MSNSVADIRANKNENIRHAAEAIGKSAARLAVFKAIYKGKRKSKTVSEICELTGLNEVRVLQEAGKLAADEIIHKTRPKSKETQYTKIPFFTHHKSSILSLVMNPQKADTFPTKQRPKITGFATNFVQFKIPINKVNFKQISIDEVPSFNRVKKLKGEFSPVRLPEAIFKKGLLAILGETGKVPKDWGGEQNDIFTNRLEIDGKRMHAAFALKGPGKNAKKLMPKDMGKNGDQIQRLMRSSAQVFFVQYWKEIDQSISEQLQQFAIAKSFSENRRIYIGIIDGIDSARLIKAYPNKFK